MGQILILSAEFFRKFDIAAMQRCAVQPEHRRASTDGEMIHLMGQAK